MTMDLKNLRNQKYYGKYVQKKNLSKKTLHSYDTAVLHFCNANNKTFDRIIHEILEEQHHYIDQQGRIHEYNPNHANIDTYLFNTAIYLQERGNKNSSVAVNLNRIRAVLHSLGVKLPKNIELSVDPEEWYSLTREDIKYVISISPLPYQALITFLAHTGIRIGDAVNFTIEDFMEATYNYHKCTELDDFLETAPQDMLGYWEFQPTKTIRHNLYCKIYNTPESSNLILKNLHKRKESIERLNQKHGLELKLEKKDGLFSSRKKQFKDPINTDSCIIFLGRKNKEFQQHKKRLLKQEFESGKISQETYNENMDHIPKFHAHGLRKFFITTLASRRVDLRASALMEGHKPPMKQDNSYVDPTNLDDLIFEEYQRIIPAISFLKDEEDFELGKKNHELLIENTQLKQDVKDLETRNLEIENSIDRHVEDKIQEVLKKYGF